MKKMIALVMSGLLAVSAVGFPVFAEPAMPSVSTVADMVWSQKAQPVSAEELALVRSQLPEKSVLPKNPEDDIQTGHGVITGPVVEAVMSQAQAAAKSGNQTPTPVLAHVTATTIVLEKVEGYWYGASDGSWSIDTGSNVINNLKPNTEYQCYLTRSGDPFSKGEAITVTTLDSVPCLTTPKAPMVQEYTDTSITLVYRPGYEYRMNDGAWTSSYLFTGLEPDTEYTFYQRIKQTGAELASEISEPLRYKTAHRGPVSSDNFQRLLDYIEDNGFEDEEGQKTVAYVITDDYGTEYYFLMVLQDGEILFDVFTYSEESEALLFNTEFLLGPNDSFVFLDFAVALYSGDTCVDYANELFDIPLNKYHIGDTLTVQNPSDYLTADELTDLCTVTAQMLFAFWDEYIYTVLGFGFRGLGFVVTEGYGDFACAMQLEAHFGDVVIKNQREGDCIVDASDGDPYCTLCGQRISDPYDPPSRGYHLYDNSCDVDCNDCGHIRIVSHAYSYACDVECDYCGMVRTDPFAPHSFGADKVCTKCGYRERLTGDVTGDGNLNMGDISKIYAHVKGSVLLTDSVTLALADVTGDGKINMGDVSRLAAHVSGRVPLW